MSLTPTLDVSTEREDLISTALQRQEASAPQHIHSSIHRTFSLVAGSWLTLLSLPLLFFPRILSLIFASFLVDAPLSAPIVSGGSSAGYDQLQQQHQQQSKQALRQLNTLETSLAALAGISLVSFASLLMLQSGVIPIVASSITSDPTKQQANVAPYRLPTAIITTLLMTGLSFGAWQLGMWVVVLASGGLAMWGGFVILFGNDTIVNRAGRSNQVSSFPFKNDHAEAVKEATRQEKVEKKEL